MVARFDVDAVLLAGRHLIAKILAPGDGAVRRTTGCVPITPPT